MADLYVHISTKKPLLQRLGEGKDAVLEFLLGAYVHPDLRDLESEGDGLGETLFGAFIHPDLRVEHIYVEPHQRDDKSKQRGLPGRKRSDPP